MSRGRTTSGLAGALASLLVVAGCGSVSVRRSRSGFTAEARPKDCPVEFLFKAPERGYGELAELYSYYPDVVEPQHVLGEKACELGADAVIVTRDFLVSHGKGPDHKFVAGIAIKYRGSTTAAQPPAPSHAPPYTPEPQQAAHAPAEPRGQLGLVLMPGGTTFDRGHTTAVTGAVGMELRGDSGGFRLRVAFEYAHDVRVADATLKFDLNDGGLFCPFLALSAGAARLLSTDDQAWHPTGSISVGFDLYIHRDFFVTIEAKQRAFTHDTPSGLRFSSLHQTSVFAGLGMFI
ncbi:MAG TPA: hypothetical protein VFP65_07270 [Anaeromyxobacteraceae bacterium]|nr:hypothetical protein [Anaeromyxobacteraceae bacterium]